MSRKKKLMYHGYTEISTKGKCKYYVRKDKQYALAVAVHKGEEYELIVEDAVFEKLGYPSIYLDNKAKKMLVPCIQRGYGYIRIHNLILQSDRKYVDHINHNRFFCTGSNLRYCEPEENAMNRRARSVRKGNGGYQFQFGVPTRTKDAIPELKNRGLCITENDTWFSVKSPIFKSEVDCYLEYRDSARIAFRGRGEEFVYDIENDFSETTDLFIRHYIFDEITEQKMYQMNLSHWRHKLDNVPVL